jgi:S-adenosylmethionine:tRNA-ribosyltransferase-isomerase (queuine synthetase)
MQKKKELLQRLPQDCYSKHLLKRIKGIKFAEVTLHVGLGTLIQLSRGFIKT